jgi:Tfp pilus assembly protein PilF
MSSKSKLKFGLLAATAVILLNPGLVSTSFKSPNADLRAQELLLPKPGLPGQGFDNRTGSIDPLLVSAPATSDLSGANAAFQPPVASVAPAAAAVAVNPNAAPGENPFLKPAAPSAGMAQRPASAPSVASVPVPQNATAAPAATVVNPFAPARAENAAPAGAALANAGTAAPAVDISALRYYASTRDLQRVGAELRRLKDLYPDWQPPKDLFTPTTAVDEEPLWKIYSTGNYAAVRASIARAQSVNPKWQPSDDLMAKLQLGETRSLISSAMAQSRWKDVISTAQALPSIMVCGEMQVQWNVAEAFARLRNYADAFEVYRYILTGCDDQNHRLATIQKASLLIPPAGLQSLLALGRTTPEGYPEFENIGFDGIRRQIGTFIEHGDFAEMPASEEIERFVNFVQRTASVQDANLIGWYFYAQKEWSNANAWFTQAAKFERDPKSIEGVVLTLRQMEKTDEALKVARHYVKMTPDIARQYIEIVASQLTADKPAIAIDEAETKLFMDTVTSQKSALGAQALGWKYLAENDKAAAKVWFADSVEWQPTEGGVVGLAVLAARARNYQALSSIKANYGKSYAALQDFKIYRVSSPRKVIKRKVVSEKPKTLADYFRKDT